MLLRAKAAIKNTAIRADMANLLVFDGVLAAVVPEEEVGGPASVGVE